MSWIKLHVNKINLPCLSHVTSGETTFEWFMFSVVIYRLVSVFHMFESIFLEIVFPQFINTGETSRFYDSGEMLNNMVIEKSLFQTLTNPASTTTVTGCDDLTVDG